jgi:hypothetical protein
MKKTPLTIALLCLCSAPAFAQQLQLPSKSPGAMIKQTVGLTDITVEYSSPAVRGRKIWGALVPYGQVWRTGANAATKLTFSKDVTINNTAVPAGTYAFFAIPTATNWTLILNKEANQGGAFNYKKEQDLLRVDVKPAAIANRERLAYLITNFTDDSASLDLEWEKIRVSLPIKMDTAKQATTSINQAVDNAWAPMNNAARYMLDTKDYTKGLEYVEKSLAIKETWFNTWVKAQLLAATGKYKDGYALAQKADELGEKAEKAGENYFAKEDVKKALAEWKGKS